MIVGINEVGHEVGNPLITNGRNLPWLQDTAEAKVWAAWGAEFRDVIVLDAENRRVGTLNLTRHDLGKAEHAATLRALIDEARRRSKPE